MKRTKASLRNRPTRRRTLKAGRAFEEVVAEIAKEFDSAPTVQTNVILQGPDGRREIDVLVDGYIGGIMRRALIECKDYNPERGPLGIAVVDALESKRRDLGIDLCALCSNAGFTADAIRKGARTGIALLGALRTGDDRIKYRLFDEIFVQNIDVERIRAGGTILGTQTFDFRDLKVDGLFVQSWFVERISKFLISLRENEKGNKRFDVHFVRPVDCEVRGQKCQLLHIFAEFDLVVQWYSQLVQHMATSGFYDWGRRRIRANPPGGLTISYKDVKLDGGDKPVDAPPLEAEPEEGEFTIGLTSIGGLPKAWGEKPDLDRYLTGDDWVAAAKAARFARSRV